MKHISTLTLLMTSVLFLLAVAQRRSAPADASSDVGRYQIIAAPVNENTHAALKIDTSTGRVWINSRLGSSDGRWKELNQHPTEGRAE